MKGSSSPEARTRSMDTSSAWLRRQIVAERRVGLVALDLADDRFGDAGLLGELDRDKL